MLLLLGHCYVIYPQYLSFRHSGLFLGWKNERILQLTSFVLYTEQFDKQPSDEEAKTIVRTHILEHKSIMNTSYITNKIHCKIVD